jgi:autotransporter-associated beta strand protein
MRFSNPKHQPASHSRFALSALAFGLLGYLLVPVHAQYYTDTGSPSNPPWSQILPTLNAGTASPGPVNGSVITVNRAATEVGLYGNRPISVGSQRIHVCCNTSTTNFGNFTRWFQTDGNTQVFRLFVNDENTATSRVGAARSEAFTVDGWTYDDNVTTEWTGRFTIARRQQEYAIFQLFNLDNEWALQLNMTASGALLVNNRRNAPDELVTNPDGSTKIFDGLGFDVRVIDDGRRYQCWIDGVLYADNFYDRPTGISRFRWGKYLGNEILTPPSTNSVILVSGAQVNSWPGRLDATITNIVKANNTQNLGNAGSWTGGTVPGLRNRVVWDSTVTTANTTTLNTEMTWAGIRITNPGGNVTINGTSLLKLENLGIDMGAATRNLTVSCPVELNLTAPWAIAANRVATFSQPIRGYPGITLSGGGSLILSADNTYTGPTEISAGVLQLGNGGTTGTLGTNSATTVATGATLRISRSDASAVYAYGGSFSGWGTVDITGGSRLDFSTNQTDSGALAFSVNGTLGIRTGSNAVTAVHLGALSGSGTVQRGAATGGSATVSIGGANTDSVFSGNIISPELGLEKIGSGTLTLNGSNTYGGATTVRAGTLAFGNVSPFDNTSAINLSGGTTLLPTVGGATINAPIRVGAAATTVFISAPTNLPGAGAVSTFALGGAISGDGDVAFTSSANQNALSTILLNAKSTYKGGTLLDTAGSVATQIIVRLGTVNALPTSTVVKMDGRTGQGTGRFADLNLNGFSQQIAGLTNTQRDLRIQRIVNSNVSAPATLTIHNTANHTFTGSLGGGASGSVSATAMPGSTNGNNFALTKGGTGTLTLNGPNTYSGHTTVNGGTLTLGSANPNNDTSSITIAGTGATLHLPFTGTDIVNELFIGGERMPAGVYKAVGNPGAGTAIPQITGSGTLTVSTGQTPPIAGYDAWKNTNGTDQPFEGDHDGDGVPNGIEHFLGGNGNTSGFTALPVVANTSGTFSLTWTKGADYSGSYDTHFVVETSESLTGVWTTEPAAPAPNATVTFPTPDTVRYTFPSPATGKKFARLKVIGP